MVTVKLLFAIPNRKPHQIISDFYLFHERSGIEKENLVKTEFGYKVRINETERGFVTGYVVYQGNASDDELLIPAVDEHTKQFGRTPNAVATDRGFNSKQKLIKRGFKPISISRKGKKIQDRTEHEQQLWFQDLQRYRAARDEKISLLKRKYGLSRSGIGALSAPNAGSAFEFWHIPPLRAARMLNEKEKWSD